MLDIWTTLLVMGRRFPLYVTTKTAQIFIFSVMDIFTDVLQIFVISDFIFISMKIFHSFSCVMRNAPFPCQLY
jgi:hypothetical protein